jgi:hypothetical protein
LKNLIVLFILIYSLNSLAVTIRDNERYTTYIIPVNELVAKDKVEAINQSIAILNEEVDNILPKSMRSSLNKSAVDKLIKYNNDHGEKLLEDLNFVAKTGNTDYFRLHQSIPSAYMALFGGKLSANIKIGGGLSGTLALVIMPAKIIRIDKLTGEQSAHYSIKMNVILLPILDVGGGAGGGATIRVGLGAIWGHLDDVTHFGGLVAGGSGNATFLGGVNFKLGSSIGLRGVKNPFATAMLEFGPKAEASVHGNIGYIINLAKLQRSQVAQATGDLLGDYTNIIQGF